LVQRGASDEVRGRVFTVIMSVNYVAYGIAVLAAGPLTDSYGPRWVYGVVGLVLLFSSLIAYVLGREEIPERSAEVEPA
jgi:MFS family permease